MADADASLMLAFQQGDESAFATLVGRHREKVFRLACRYLGDATAAEDLAQEHDQREAWDIVTARAVGSLAEVAELGLPLARQGGVLVAWKSAGPEAEKAQQEISAAQRIIRTLGGDWPRVVPLPSAEKLGLPGRCLVVIDKVRTTPDGYPRSAGERRRRPLG